MEMFYDKEHCSGCGLCSFECPKNAIIMKQDEEGFIYPHIQQELCINCGKCVCVCPNRRKFAYTENDIIQCFAAENLDEKIRLNSSSGGVFSALASRILLDGGVVVSPRYNENFELNHKIINKVNDFEAFRGSKYTQSRIGHLYEPIEQELKTGRKVLFTGTPCQTSAMREAFGNKYDNLVLQDVICHGCASEKIMKYYLGEKAKEFNSEIDSICFRDKSNGWRDFSLKIVFKNGKIINESHKTNKFFQMHLKNIALRPSCYDCHFRKGNRDSDISLGDFWGHKGDDNKGTSVILVHTEKGKKLVEEVALDLKMDIADKNEVLQNNIAYNSALEVPKKRKRFFSDKNHEIEHLYQLYVRRTIIDKVSDRIKKYVRK